MKILTLDIETTAPQEPGGCLPSITADEPNLTTL